jgi:putative oxidoreductase
VGEIATGLGYLLLGGVFVFAGIDHFLRFEAVRGMLADRGWPRPAAVLAVASVFQVVAGLALIAGILRAWAALGLAGFTLAASLLLLDFWNFEGPPREGLRSGFTVNLALVGGLLIAFGQGL